MTTELKESLKGQRIGSTVGRRPAIHEDGRVCASNDCDTILSRYNPRSRCRVHAIPRYPRLRGQPL